ncbi:hypothetical protein FQR65_LT02152 [Abscondita terminalis]|nr:hypothetical protein FQR65_LT02152 [Abscondita terminalis]
MSITGRRMLKTIAFFWFPIISLTNYVGFAKNENVKKYIVGGESVLSRGIYTYQVSLQYQNRHFCGGAIISNRLVLTAAHCLEKMSVGFFTINVGMIDVTDATRTKYTVKQMFVHQNYNSTQFFNDIGLLVTHIPIVFNANVHEIKLYEGYLTGEKTCVATGWGALAYEGKSPIMLQMLTTSTITNQRCKDMQRSAPPPIFENTNICTYREKGKGLCSGDSGGPLVCDNKLVGIVSWSRKCAYGYPEVFSRIYGYLDWINQVKMYIVQNNL